MRTLTFSFLCGLMAWAQTATADDFLMYGPSLAVYIAENCEQRGDCRNAERHDDDGFDVRGITQDESHFATDAGHNVTIASASEWTSMTQQQFAAYDAIVFGDAGCNGDSSLLDPADSNKATWSAAVTGNLFLHTLDNVYHYNENELKGTRGGSSDEEEFQAQLDLAVDGMEFAAAGDGTGLYYSHGCREGLDPDRGSPVALFSILAPALTILNGDGDDVQIALPDHPSMANLTDSGLSDWGDSFHGIFDSFDAFFDVVAVTGENTRGQPQQFPPVILARGEAAESVLEVPGLDATGIALLSALLALAGALVLHRRA